MLRLFFQLLTILLNNVKTLLFMSWTDSLNENDESQISVAQSSIKNDCSTENNINAPAFTQVGGGKRMKNRLKAKNLLSKQIEKDKCKNDNLKNIEMIQNQMQSQNQNEDIEMELGNDFVNQNEISHVIPRNSEYSMEVDEVIDFQKHDVVNSTQNENDIEQLIASFTGASSEMHSNKSANLKEGPVKKRAIKRLSQNFNRLSIHDIQNAENELYFNILNGTFSQFSKEEMSPLTLGKQCTTMSVISTICAHSISPSTWTSSILDEILKTGDKIHLTVMQYLNEKNIQSNGYSSVDDLIEVSPLEFRNQKYKIENKNSELMNIIAERDSIERIAELLDMFNVENIEILNSDLMNMVNENNEKNRYHELIEIYSKDKNAKLLEMILANEQKYAPLIAQLVTAKENQTYCKENLTKQLEICFPKYSNCILTINDYTYSILLEGNSSTNTYHFFDSHSQKSSLWSFQNIENLTNFILQRHPSPMRNSYRFDLNPIKIELIQNPDKDTAKTVSNSVKNSNKPDTIIPNLPCASNVVCAKVNKNTNSIKNELYPKFLHGTFAQTSKQMSSETRSKQCTTMCVTGIICASLKSPSIWTTADMDQILRQGDMHHKSVLRYLKRNGINSYGFSSVDDIIHISPLEFQNQLFQIENKNGELQEITFERIKEQTTAELIAMFTQNEIDARRINLIAESELKKLETEKKEVKYSNADIIAMLSGEHCDNSNPELIANLLENNKNYQTFSRENVMTQLQICFSKFDNCVLVIGVYSYGILMEKIDCKNIYHFFDSHATNGKSSLWSFDNIGYLVDLVMNKGLANYGHFDLTPLNIVKLDLIPNNHPDLSSDKMDIDQSEIENENKKLYIKLVHGTFSQASLEEMSPATAGKQCTTMSVVSILCASLQSPSIWTSLEMDQILKKGDIHHATVLEYFQNERIQSNGCSPNFAP